MMICSDRKYYGIGTDICTRIGIALQMVAVHMSVYLRIHVYIRFVATRVAK